MLSTLVTFVHFVQYLQPNLSESLPIMKGMSFQDVVTIYSTLNHPTLGALGASGREGLCKRRSVNPRFYISPVFMDMKDNFLKN